MFFNYLRLNLYYNFKTTKKMKTTKKCIYCNEYITLNKEELKMLEEGSLNFQFIDCCDDCSNNQNNEEDYFAGYDSEF